MKPLLSKKAIRVLEDNGYRFKQDQMVITFHRAFDYVSIIVVSVLTIIVGFPATLFNPLAGACVFMVGIGGLLVKYLWYSKKMKFRVDLRNQKFDFSDREINLSQQSLSYATKISMHSEFKDEYTSSFKETSEEHHITIGLELKSGSAFTCFTFLSDYAKPSEEILEVYRLVKKFIRWTKTKDTQLGRQIAIAE